MPTAIEITDPHIHTYTRVLPVGPGVCAICHGAPPKGFNRCRSCSQTTDQVSHPVRLVVPISLTEVRGQLHHVLWAYKRESYPEKVRAPFRLQISALMTRFLGQHGNCIRRAAHQDWDAITIVPSSQGRAGVHPLEDAIRLSPLLLDQYQPLLRPGPGKADHNQASDQAYDVVDSVSGMSVLLLDDTFTSGARAQSAASSLYCAGANVVAMVPIGRIINRDFSHEASALLDRAKEEPFDFDVCCLEG